MSGEQPRDPKGRFGSTDGTVPDPNVLDQRRDRLDPQRPVPAERERTAADVDADIDSVTVRIVQLQTEARKATAQLHDLETERLMIDRVALTADFQVKREVAKQALDELRRTVTLLPVEPDQAQLSELQVAISAVHEADDDASAAASAAQRANGWDHEAPEIAQGDADLDGSNRLMTDAVHIGYYHEALSRSRETAERNGLTPFGETEWLRAISDIKEHGYGDGNEMPCNLCAVPMRRYDYQQYMCARCD